jgi:hypothetical protein
VNYTAASRISAHIEHTSVVTTYGDTSDFDRIQSVAAFWSLGLALFCHPEDTTVFISHCSFIATATTQYPYHVRFACLEGAIGTANVTVAHTTISLATTNAEQVRIINIEGNLTHGRSFRMIVDNVTVDALAPIPLSDARVLSTSALGQPAASRCVTSH